MGFTNRRRFLSNAITFLGASAVLGPHLALSEDAASSWRTFDLTTHVELQPTVRATRIWVPLPLKDDQRFQQCLGNTVQCSDGRWSMQASSGKASMVTAEFPPRSEPILKVVSRVRVRDWSVDLHRPTPVREMPSAERKAFLEATRYVPTDGVVRSKALDITSGAQSDEDRARAIYNWIVTDTCRKSSVRGCGNGNIRPLLETGDLGGKCADLSALFVGLARAAGLPARDVYGIRVAPSRLGYASLGPATSKVSHAQHCRAEVWLECFGWVPVDPADVHKVMLEEPPGHLSMKDPKVQSARERLFGSWEMNWVAFNFAQDIALPGSQGPALPFFMYPQAETAEGRLDSLDPENFRYEITSTSVL